MKDLILLGLFDVLYTPIWVALMHALLLVNKSDCIYKHVVIY